MGLYRSVEDALFRRLQGGFNPVKQARGKLPADLALGGSIAHERLPPVNQDAIRASVILGGRVRKVAVLYEDKGGQDANLWPAVTIRFDDERARRSDWRQEDDRKRCVGTAFQHNARTGVELSGPDLIETVAAPDPVTLVYEVKVWSQDHAEGKELLEHVKQVCPINGFLELEANDGEIYTVDMLRVDGPNWVGGIDPTLAEGDAGNRFYAWSILYDIEAYEDNSLLTTLAPTIRQRNLEYAPSVDQDAEPENDVVTLDVHGKAPS